MSSKTIAVVGLGYVGLPLAVAFGRRHRTIGYDQSEGKIRSYREYTDPTGQISSAEMKSANSLSFTADPAELSVADFIIIAVPTPVDVAHQPDFSPLISASETVGKYMKRGSIVIYESTVYPGATEETCVPVLEKVSGLRWRDDFHVGYSPERINPGDKDHTLATIVKVVSGDDVQTLDSVASLYLSIVEAGVHRASSIKVAEAAKVIENTQRDLNIALMNELAIIFHKLGIKTHEVLAAAGTKWNFLQFRPGLVGGHCIGVDPYYLTYKAESIGYHPQVILAGRRINDGMGKFVAEQTVKQMIRGGSLIRNSKVNVLGLTFKEDCPDVRNTKVLDLIEELRTFGVEVFVHDPVCDPNEVVHEYGITVHAMDRLPKADATVIAVAHQPFKALSAEVFGRLTIKGGCLIDIKSIVSPSVVEAAGLRLWQL